MLLAVPVSPKSHGVFQFDGSLQDQTCNKPIRSLHLHLDGFWRLIGPSLAFKKSVNHEVARLRGK